LFLPIPSTVDGQEYGEAKQWGTSSLV